MAIIKGIFIDAVNHKVSEVELEGLEGLQKAVGGYIEIAHEFADSDGNYSNTLFVDEEGLLKSPSSFFTLEGAHQPFAGNGIIVGVNSEGESTDTTLDMEAIKSRVYFLDMKQLKAML